jgi:hypothetical protein
VVTKIGDLEQPENPRLVNERGGFERPTGKPPGVLESPAITRAAWRLDALTQRCYLAPLLAGTGRKAPHRRSVLPAGRDNYTGP